MVVQFESSIAQNHKDKTKTHHAKSVTSSTTNAKKSDDKAVKSDATKTNDKAVKSDATKTNKTKTAKTNTTIKNEPKKN